MARYAIIDIANLFHRARHVVRGDAFMKAGMSLHIVFRSLRKLHRDYQVDHMVFCVEGKSWRYDVFPQYKGKRRLDRMSKSTADKEEDEAFFSVLNDFTEFLKDKTRCTVLHHPKVEGDDFVARWIQVHKDDDHIILSGDSDFVQLIAPNVSIYNGVDDRLLTQDGVFDGKGTPMEFHVNPSDGKIKVPGTIEEMKKKHDKAQKELEKAHIASEKARGVSFAASEKSKKNDDPEYVPQIFVPSTYEWVEYDFTPEPEWWRLALFVKLIRGDTGDGIFSAYPGVRWTSKSKVGIQEAWEDRKTQGFNWNNFMLQRWEKLVETTPDGQPITEQVRVLDQYRFNELLIDLSKQPDDVITMMDETIMAAIEKGAIGNVGIHFMRFCDRNQLPNLTKEAHDHAAYLKAPYR
jgi:hypothetical protein